MQVGSILKAILLLIGISLISETVNAQTFEEWKRQQQEEFQAYKDKFDEEFIKMLKATWEEVGINTGSKFYEDEKPVELPTFTPPPPPPPRPDIDNDEPEDEIIEERITIDLELEFDSNPLDLPPPAPMPVQRDEPTGMFEGLDVDDHSITFFSNEIPLTYPEMVKSKLNPRDFRNGQIDNNKIAKFWEIVSSVNHTEFVDHTIELRTQMGLNDWGYILLINGISKSIFGEQNSNLVRMMNWFLLTKAGYQNRVGYDQDGVYNLFTVSNNIFNTKYYTLDGSKFFPINFNEEYQTPTSIFTYQGVHEAQVRKLDLTIEQYPEFVNSTRAFTRNLEFEFEQKNYSIPVTVNRDIVSYFEYYPLTDLPIFFTASLSPTTYQQLATSLQPILETMTELEAVNFLLRLVQTSFDYKTDQDQFDREKYMMPDEIFFYQYSDCDDRSIFFATLVRDILGLDVVGLRYSRHLAVAVHFTRPVEGDYHMSDGKKFVVADPTYINAPVGLTMSSYMNERPNIVKF